MRFKTILPFILILVPLMINTGCKSGGGGGLFGPDDNDDFDGVEFRCDNFGNHGWRWHPSGIPVEDKPDTYTICTSEAADEFDPNQWEDHVDEILDLCLERCEKVSGTFPPTHPYVCEKENFRDSKENIHPKFGWKAGDKPNCVVADLRNATVDGSDIDWSLGDELELRPAVTCDLNTDCCELFEAQICGHLSQARLTSASGVGGDFLANSVEDTELTIDMPRRNGDDTKPLVGEAEYTALDCAGDTCPFYLAHLVASGDESVWNIRVAPGVGKSVSNVRVDLMQPVLGSWSPSDGRIAFQEGALKLRARFTIDGVTKKGNGDYDVVILNDRDTVGVFDNGSLQLQTQFPVDDGNGILSIRLQPQMFPPVAQVEIEPVVECNAGDGAVLAPSVDVSFDPDGGEIMSLVFVDGALHPLTVPVALGSHTLQVRAQNSRGSAKRSELVEFEVVDTTSPSGSITSPADCACFGPASLPVEIRDDFEDTCSQSLTRSYSPNAGPYTRHGDHQVALTVEDLSGNRSSSVHNFTIDLVPPVTELRSPEAKVYAFADDFPIAIDLVSVDDDGAAGGVVHEQLLLDGALLYDGDTFGDADGRLSDEISAAALQGLVLGLDELCPSRWGLTGTHELTLVARDCGGNSEAQSVSFTVTIPGNACKQAVPRELVINEVDYDQGEDDSGEFVEIKNIGSTTIDLGDYALRTYYYGPFETHPRSARYERYPMESMELAPGDYHVVCTEDNSRNYCNQLVTPTGWGYLDPELLRETSPGAVALAYNVTSNHHHDRIVDSVCYIGSETPGDPGHGVPGELPGGSFTEFRCNTQIETESQAGISRIPEGRDRNNNLGDLRQTCITPGEPNSASLRSCETGGEALGQLVINELDVNQPQHPDPAEFIEIYNSGATSVHLSDYMMVHRYLDQATSFYPIEARLRLPDQVLDAGGYFVACRTGLSFNACQDDLTFSLNDRGGVVALVHNTTGLPDHDLLVDSVGYGSPNAALAGGPPGGGLWVEGLPIGELDGVNAISGTEGVGFSRQCEGSDTDGNSSDFVLSTITPGGPNLPR